jgi:hypothetical protein
MRSASGVFATDLVPRVGASGRHGAGDVPRRFTGTEIDALTAQRAGQGAPIAESASSQSRYAAKKAGFLFYSQVSGDAAHRSITALEHFQV